MLTAEQTTKLTAIQNYATRYEITATDAAGNKFRLRYTPRYSGRGLLDALIAEKKAIVAAVTGSAEGTADLRSSGSGKSTVYTVTDGARELTIRFSLRTQRDAILAGENPRLPYYG